eukprot:41096-Rhodomonas_salina.1
MPLRATHPSKCICAAALHPCVAALHPNKAAVQPLTAMALTTMTITCAGGVRTAPSGTTLCYAPSVLRNVRCLRACYSKSGTELAYGATRRRGVVFGGGSGMPYAMMLRLPYAKSGTDLAYAAIGCCALPHTLCDAPGRRKKSEMRCTDVQYGGTARGADCAVSHRSVAVSSR